MPLHLFSSFHGFYFQNDWRCLPILKIRPWFFGVCNCYQKFQIRVALHVCNQRSRRQFNCKHFWLAYLRTLRSHREHKMQLVAFLSLKSSVKLKKKMFKKTRKYANATKSSAKVYEKCIQGYMRFKKIQKYITLSLNQKVLLKILKKI